MQILTAQQVKDARAGLSLSQRRLALDADVSRPMLSLFEQQRAVPNDDFLVKLRDFFVEQGVDLPSIDDEPAADPLDDLIDDELVDDPVGLLSDSRIMDGISVPIGVSDEEAEVVLEQLGDIEEEIAELQARQVDFPGVFIQSPPSEESTAVQQRLRLLMARSFCLIRGLQGRDSVEPCCEMLGKFQEGGETGDQATWLSQVFADVFGSDDSGNDPDAPTKRTDVNWLGVGRDRDEEKLVAVGNGG